MIRRLPYILLGLSITFNVFFAGGFLEARSASVRLGATDGADLVAERLGLSPEQRQAYERLRDEASGDARQAREAIFAARQEFWTMLGDESADPAQLRDLVEFEADQGRQLRVQMLGRCREFMGVLAPPQRAALVEAVLKREAGRPGARPVLGQFDADGDGRLSDAERAAVRERFRSRWMEAQRGRARLLERFDADGDGRLDPEEWAEAMKALDAWRAGGHPGPGGPPRAGPPSAPGDRRPRPGPPAKAGPR